MTTPTPAPSYPTFSFGGPVIVADPADVNHYTITQTTDVHLGPVKPPPPVLPPRRLLFGASDLTQFAGINLGVHRSYFGLEDTGYHPDQALAIAKADAAAGRKTVISVGRGRTLNSWPAGGPDLNKLQQFLPAFTANPDTVVIGHHEPENDAAGDMAHPNIAARQSGYKGWFTSFADFVRKSAPHVRLGVCFMAWTLRNGGPGITGWLPDPALYDVFCIDGYAQKGDKLANLPLANALPLAKSLHKPLIVAETGMNSDGDQPGFLAELVGWWAANPEIEAISWWPGDGPNGHYHPQPLMLAALQTLATQKAWTG